MDECRAVWRCVLSIVVFRRDFSDQRERLFMVQGLSTTGDLRESNDLKYNADGSLDIYIQNQSPGKTKEANWLPAPKDKFILMMRLYWPKEKAPSIIDGSWNPPHVKLSAE